MHKNFLYIFVLLALISCETTKEEVKTVSLNGEWNKKAEQKFDFEIKDAQNAKNIIFVVRNNNDYPYSNIWLIVNFKNLKTKKTKTDTLNYILAKPNGEWIGSGFGDAKETLFQYKINYKFPENGKYEIGISQGMRKDKLVGIEDVGVKIETLKAIK